MVDVLPSRPRKGRGTISNHSGRYEPHDRVAVDDGWLSEEEQLLEPPLRTTVEADASRTIIARNDSPDVPFDRSINPYRGCEHGCVYCFARPGHAYLGLSPGLDFETRIFAKHDAPDLLRAALRKPGYRPATLALGAVTDVYQPIERELKTTRRLLAVLLEARHPVTILTKSALVLRDLDLLVPLAKQNLVRVCVSVTSLDAELARRMEPRAAPPSRRLATIARLASAGVPVAVLTAPLIPAINDHELEAILAAAAERGADGASYVLLRLPLELGPLFEEWLDTHYPDRKQRVLRLLKEMRGGRLYDSRWGHRMRGEGVVAELIERRFRTALARHGMSERRWTLDASKFTAPAADRRQLSLL